MSAAKLWLYMTDGKHLPGRGFLGWLGRQVGYVARAIRHPVGQHSGTVDPKASAQTIYQEKSVLEAPMPGNSQITLRRTVIDEAIVKRDDAER